MDLRKSIDKGVTCTQNDINSKPSFAFEFEVKSVLFFLIGLLAKIIQYAMRHSLKFL